MTPKVKIALFCLQLYIVFILILIIIKFIKGL